MRKERVRELDGIIKRYKQPDCDERPYFLLTYFRLTHRRLN
jgi:hypothetical protein